MAFPREPRYCWKDGRDLSTIERCQTCDCNPKLARLTYISVNGAVLARNSRTGSRDPVIAVRTSKTGKPRYCSKVRIEGPCELVYQHDAPILKCGARLVIIARMDDVVCE